jgi:hypothetical protein
MSWAEVVKDNCRRTRDGDNCRQECRAQEGVSVLALDAHVLSDLSPCEVHRTYVHDQSDAIKLNFICITCLLATSPDLEVEHRADHRLLAVGDSSLMHCVDTSCLRCVETRISKCEFGIVNRFLIESRASRSHVRTHPEPRMRCRGDSSRRYRGSTELGPLSHFAEAMADSVRR